MSARRRTDLGLKQRVRAVLPPDQAPGAFHFAAPSGVRKLLPRPLP